jgi:hypothetical protein
MPVYGPLIAGSPNVRTLAASTAYQATNPNAVAIINLNLTSSAALSISGGTTNSADIVIGPTNAVASGTGTVIGKYSNSSTGTLTIGLNTATVAACLISFVLPAGWFMAWRITSGSVTATSAFDQQIS